jgi:mono/diheme cytochrome c family protein
MKRVLKWIGIVLGSLVVLVILIVIGVYFSVSMRLSKTYTIQPEDVAIPVDTAALERGQHWVSIHCAGCHGEDLGGTAFFEDLSLGSIPAPNLTAGQGGVGGLYTDADWVRAIRHGVKPDGKPLLIMPAKDFYHFSQEDLGVIIAYVKSIPVVDREVGEPSLTVMAKMLLAFGAFGDIINAETIDHTAPLPSVPEPGVTEVYGAYLIKTGGCTTCHGAELAGGKDPNPQAPPAPNLTPGGELGGWSEADFIAAMRTGMTPDGRQLSEFMPWQAMSRMTDDELRAVWLYLQTLPAKESAVVNN